MFRKAGTHTSSLNNEYTVASLKCFLTRTACFWPVAPAHSQGTVNSCAVKHPILYVNLYFPFCENSVQISSHSEMSCVCKYQTRWLNFGKGLTVNIPYFFSQTPKQLQSMQSLLWIHFSSYDLIFLKDARVLFRVCICLYQYGFTNTKDTPEFIERKWKVEIRMHFCLKLTYYIWYLYLLLVVWDILDIFNSNVYRSEIKWLTLKTSNNPSYARSTGDKDTA